MSRLLSKSKDHHKPLLGGSRSAESAQPALPQGHQTLTATAASAGTWSDAQSDDARTQADRFLTSILAPSMIPRHSYWKQLDLIEIDAVSALLVRVT